MSGPSESMITQPLLAVAIAFPILATLAVFLRFYARKIKSQEFRADDWMIVFSLLMCWALSISTIVDAAVVGVGTTTLNPVVAADFTLKSLWIGGIFLCIVLTAVKISILMFYRRIFVTRIFRRCVDAMIGVLLCWGIGSMLAQILCGNPVSSAWDVTHLHFRFNYWDYALAVAGISIVLDLMVLCFPIPVIRQLKLPTQRKLSVLAIFWLGAFCCIAAAIRFHALYESIQMEKRVNVTNYHEITSAQIWQHIEPSCSVIAACLPTYGNLFAGKSSLLGSFRSYFSLRSRFSSGKDDLSGGARGSEKTLALSSSNKSHKSGENWQMLDKSSESHSWEITTQNKSGEHRNGHDVEAGLETDPYKIGITREFGSETEVK